MKKPQSPSRKIGILASSKTSEIQNFYFAFLAMKNILPIS